jgi:hypothetical protein
MRIDFDMCSLQRPLDDKSQLRVHLEAEALLGIIEFCESGQAELVSSDALLTPAPQTSGNASKTAETQAIPSRQVPS